MVLSEDAWIHVLSPLRTDARGINLCNPRRGKIIGEWRECGLDLSIGRYLQVSMLLLVIVSRSPGLFGSPIPVAGDCLVQLRWVGGLWDIRQFAEYSESGMHRPLKRPLYCIFRALHR